MLYVNTSSKNIILYGNHGVKHVIPSGGEIESNILPEVTSHAAFKPKKAPVAIAEAALPTSNEISSKISATVASLEEKVSNLQNMMLDLVKDIAVLQSKAVEETKESKKTTREPKA